MSEEEASPSFLRNAGLIVGPLLAVAVWALLPHGPVAEGGLSSPARACAAIGALMACWWLTEAIPLAATALLPLALFPVLGIMSMKATATPYANEVVFLFMGGFMIQQAMERWNLHQRLALLTLMAVGTRPSALIGGIMAATAFISMWVSNAATAAMMLPIAVSVCAMVETHYPAPLPAQQRSIRNFSTCLVLVIAYAATIGGLATPVGTPPNMLLLAYLRDHYQIEVSFGAWMAMGVPLMVVLCLATWLIITRVVFPVKLGPIPGERTFLKDRWAQLGPVKPGEWATLSIFLLAVAAWISREPLCDLLGLVTETASKVPGGLPVRQAMLTDAGIAIAAALLLFMCPVGHQRTPAGHNEVVFALDWHHAAKLPFGVLILFGGGLSLADAITATGIDLSVGKAFAGLSTLHPLLLVLLLTACVVFLSELVSNTALVATFLPITAAAAKALGVHPLLLMLPMTLGASTAFMLPAGTPPNAIVFASGRITIRQMARAGLLLNLVSIVLVTALVYFAGSALLGIDLHARAAR